MFLSGTRNWVNEEAPCKGIFVFSSKKKKNGKTQDHLWNRTEETLAVRCANPPGGREGSTAWRARLHVPSGKGGQAGWGPPGSWASSLFRALSLEAGV